MQRAFSVAATLVGFSQSLWSDHHTVSHYEPALGVKVADVLGSIATHGSRQKRKQPFADSIEVSFKAFGVDVQVQLDLIPDLYHPDFNFEFRNDTHVEKVSPTLHSYDGKYGKNGVVSVIVNDDGSLTGILRDDAGEMFTIEPLATAHDMTKDRFNSLAGVANHVIYRDPRRSVPAGSPALVNHVTGVGVSGGKRLLAPFGPDTNLEVWNPGCYPGDDVGKSINFGFAVDFGFYQATGGSQKSAQDAITELVQFNNRLYTEQMKVKFVVKKTMISTSLNENSPWNQDASCSTAGGRQGYDARLRTFTTWRAAQQTANADDPAMWHLMTNCYPVPGVVGLAWVGTICDKSSSCGWSNYIGNKGTWKVVAHEIGHNFGAPHSFENGQGKTGGIMDYGDGLYNGIYQFHTLKKPQVCGEIKQALGLGTQGTRNCFYATTTTGATYAWTTTMPGGICFFTDPRKCGTGVYMGTVVCRQTLNSADTTVADSFCSGMTKPNALTAGCNGATCPTTPTAECGNGLVETLETCDTGTRLDPCCVKCIKSTTTACQAGSGALDAAVRIPNNWPVAPGKVYAFKGSQYSRIAQIGAAPDAGYPKNIVAWPGLTGTFGSNIDDVVSKNDGHLVFFKGNQYAWYHIGQGMHTGMPQPLTDVNWKATTNGQAAGYLDLAASFTTGIDAAVEGKQNTFIFLFKGTQYVKWFWEMGMESGYPRPLSFFTGMPFATTGVDAAVFDGTSMVTFYKGENMCTYEYGVGSNGVISKAPGLNFGRAIANGLESQNTLCSVENCNTCSEGSATKCARCSPGFALQRSNTICNPHNLLVNFPFDNTDEEKAIASLSGQGTYVTGLVGMALNATSTAVLNFKKVEFPVSGAIEIDFWCAPFSVNVDNQTLLTAFQPLIGAGQVFQLSLVLTQDPDNNATTILVVKVQVGNRQVWHTTSVGAYPHWNHVSVRLDEQLITVSVGGTPLRIEFELPANAAGDMAAPEMWHSFTLDDWHLGDSTHGMAGMYDMLFVSDPTEVVPPDTFGGPQANGASPLAARWITVVALPVAATWLWQ